MIRRALPGAVLGLLLLPAASFAAEGMPQLDFANPLTISQVVWGALIFVAMYLALAHWGLPQVQGVLDARAASIAGDLDAARGAKTAADVASGELAETTRRARAEAQAAINAAVEQAKSAAASAAAEANARLDAQLKSAEAQIAGARSAAMGALRQVASETAGAVVARLTGAQPDAAAVDGAVGAALAARR